MLIPGIIESHFHPKTAIVAASADLQHDSVEEVLAAVKGCAEAHPTAKVIRGFGCLRAQPD